MLLTFTRRGQRCRLLNGCTTTTDRGAVHRCGSTRPGSSCSSSASSSGGRSGSRFSPSLSGARTWVARAATAGSGRWSAWKRRWAACASAWSAWLAASVPGRAPSCGNHAFDEYRTETLRRLEDEQREFRDFLERLRYAKDKEEFDQFMADRRSRQTPEAPSRRADLPRSPAFSGRSPKGGRPDAFHPGSALELLDVFRIIDFLIC